MRATRFTYFTSNMSSPLAVEGTVDPPLAEKLLEATVVSSYTVHHVDRGELDCDIVIPRINLVSFPALYLPFLLTHITYSEPEICLLFIRQLAASALPDLVTLMDGEQLKHRVKSKDVRLKHFADNLGRAGEDRKKLHQLLWSQWFMLLGESVLRSGRRGGR